MGEGQALKSLSNRRLKRTKGSMVLVGCNPLLASASMDVYREWLNFQVLSRLTELCLDIGTGFQISRRQFAEVLVHLQGCAPRPAQGQVVPLPWKGEQANEFQCYGDIWVDPYFKAVTVAKRRVDRPGKRTNDHSLHSNFGTIKKLNRNRKLMFESL
jgi:hypothetical protein